MKNLTQIGLKRKTSNHAAILLKEEFKDWGPKPFKFVNSWLKEEGFKKMVEEEWRNCKVQGWSGFVIKEKLKHVRKRIWVWHREKFGSLDKKIEESLEEVKMWDDKLESDGLSSTEVDVRRAAWE